MDKVVKVALDAMFGGPMKAKSIANLADQAKAIETFSLLRKKGCGFTPDNVCAYVSSNFEWSAEALKELKKLLIDICAGKRKKRPAGYGPAWKEGIFEEWESIANKNP